MAGLLQNVKLFGEYIPWFQALRDKGQVSFKAQGVPTAKTEEWKYTKPRDLNADDFVIAPSNFLEELRAESEETCGCHHECRCGEDCHCQDENMHDCHCGEDDSQAQCHCHGDDCRCGHNHHELNLNYQIPFDAYQIHFVNGKFIPIFPALPRGVEVITLMEAVLIEEAKDYLGKILDLERHPFAALNTAYMEEGIFIRVNKNVKLDKPIMIINHTEVGEENLFFNLRNLIVLESGAEAELIEWYKYAGAQKSRYFVNVVNEIMLGKGAKLNHYKWQDDAFKANHLSMSAVKQKADSQYHNFCLQKGADIGRNEVKVRLTDENAFAEINAAYIMSGWATLDTTTDIEHLSPQTFSEQLVKGVVNGDAKGVFQGKIHIAHDAVKTEGRQLHKALLLSDTAEIDVKPELEIFADDVKCSHGAASGELDEQQLFYMQSRGISLEDAKQILIDAYLEDVIVKIDNAGVREWIKAAARPSEV